MTSIYDIPYEDIKEFLLANYITYDDENDAYNEASKLVNDKKAIGHTTSIIEWMMAYNLLKRNINIPNYTTSEINKMSQPQINQLAKSLKMNGNNVENIKNILKYLHKLDNKNKLILPETNDIIFNLLSDLEVNDLNFDTLTPNDVINLLKTHRNKALIRKLAYENMDKIILYNFLPNFKIDILDDLWYFRDLAYDLPNNVILKLIEINEDKLKDYSIEERDQLFEELNDMKEEGFGSNILNIYQNIEKLTDFFLNLIKINELGLAKKVFDIANEYDLSGQIANSYYSFNQYLISTFIFGNLDIKINDTLLSFIGEDNFMSIVSGQLDTLYIRQLINKLVISELYELFIKVLDLLISKNYKGKGVLIKKILPRIQGLIKSKEKANVIIEELNRWVKL